MSAPKRSPQFMKTGHAPGHIRECLLDAIDAQENWWQNLEMDFDRDRHQSAPRASSGGLRLSAFHAPGGRRIRIGMRNDPRE